jgi:hypothetical protein
MLLRNFRLNIGVLPKIQKALFLPLLFPEHEDFYENNQTNPELGAGIHYHPHPPPQAHLDILF